MTERENRPPSVPADPTGIEEPHDILAADEFGIGTRDERLPPDPSGIQVPHDVLAAEEFAMPAAGEPHGEPGRRDARALIPLLLAGALLGAIFVRRRT
jgi:hypothetical protein